MEKIVQAFLKHLSERNLDELCNLFSEEVDWYIPGHTSKVAWLGKRNNKHEVKAFYELLWENTEPISAVINNILSNDHVVIISGEFSTKMLQTNKIVDSLFFIEFEVNAEKIIKYRLLEDSYAVSEALVE